MPKKVEHNSKVLVKFPIIHQHVCRFQSINLQDPSLIHRCCFFCGSNLKKTYLQNGASMYDFPNMAICYKFANTKPSGTFDKLPVRFAKISAYYASEAQFSIANTVVKVDG